MKKRHFNRLYYIIPFLKGSRSIFFILSLFFVSIGFAQDKKSLEEKRKKIQTELEQASKLLQETKKNQESSVNELQLIGKKIHTREELISTINLEVNLLDKNILAKQKIIFAMEGDLKKLKLEYGKMLQQAFKTRSDYNKMMFVLSSKDFNQAYKRIKYLQQYAEYRLKQMKLIRSTQVNLNNKLVDLKKAKNEKIGLLQKENIEKIELNKERNQRQATLESLKNKEKDLKKEIDKKRKEVASLKKAIEDAIAKEMEAMKAKKETVAEAKETTVLMDKFEKNMGKLPWPVEKGIITSKFGRQKHEVLSNIEINNNGIDITSSVGAEARAIFEGTVSKIIIIPNAGKAVLVRHGEYLSVYFQLNTIYVNAGDKVSTLQKIGSIITTEQNKTELHFELWKGKTILNPSKWLNGAN